MPETFGFRLKRFALAVDIVDDLLFNQIWTLILDYLSSYLHPSYWALLTEDMAVNMNRGLSATQCSLAAKPSFSFRTPEGNYNGLAAYAFEEGKPLWVVSPDQCALGPETPLLDKWSHATDLPRFDRSQSEGISTVVLVPLCWRGRKEGLLDLQSRLFLKMTKRASEELEHLAEALAVLLPLFKGQEERRQHTIEAINLHRKALSEERWPSFSEPQIFVASSARADPRIMGEIRDTLNQFEDRLQICYWKDRAEGGNINAKMMDQIRDSQFGLCYFSEPADESRSKVTYKDNANVVFEAGMLQALTQDWIPVRESESPAAPFDLAHERTVFIQRDSNNQPNLEALRSSLITRLQKIAG